MFVRLQQRSKPTAQYRSVAKEHVKQSLQGSHFWVKQQLFFSIGHYYFSCKQCTQYSNHLVKLYVKLN